MSSRPGLAIMRVCATGLAEFLGAGMLLTRYRRGTEERGAPCKCFVRDFRWLEIARVGLDSVTGSVRSDTMRDAARESRLQR